ncbi:hypothetical protein [Dyadobacter bucti]|uniref:hypothetical protein n=1 Tax=Dyadobacter bucti TaxID=2572203 RepID=UPI003F71FDF5
MNKFLHPTITSSLRTHSPGPENMDRNPVSFGFSVSIDLTLLLFSLSSRLYQPCIGGGKRLPGQVNI